MVGAIWRYPCSRLLSVKREACTMAGTFVPPAPQRVSPPNPQDAKAKRRSLSSLVRLSKEEQARVTWVASQSRSRM